MVVMYRPHFFFFEIHSLCKAWFEHLGCASRVTYKESSEQHQWQERNSRQREEPPNRTVLQPSIQTQTKNQAHLHELVCLIQNNCTQHINTLEQMKTNPTLTLKHIL
jgi:hypothetical protein